MVFDLESVQTRCSIRRIFKRKNWERYKRELEAMAQIIEQEKILVKEDVESLGLALNGAVMGFYEKKNLSLEVCTGRLCGGTDN